MHAWQNLNNGKMWASICLLVGKCMSLFAQFISRCMCWERLYTESSLFSAEDSHQTRVLFLLASLAAPFPENHLSWSNDAVIAVHMKAARWSPFEGNSDGMERFWEKLSETFGAEQLWRREFSYSKVMSKHRLWEGLIHSEGWHT